MNRAEFLEGLKVAMSSEADAQTLQENIEYYSQYISEQVRAGRSEQEVLEELGDPWLIARSILDVQGAGEQEAYVYEERDGSYRQSNESRGGIHFLALDTWWKKLLLVLVIVGIVGLVLSVVAGVISLAAPIIFPLLIVMIIVRMFQKR